MQSILRVPNLFSFPCSLHTLLKPNCRWRSWPTSHRSPATTARRCTPSSWPPGYTGCGGRKCGWAAAAAEARARAGPQTRISGLGGSMTQVRKWLEDKMRRCSILIWPGSSEWPMTNDVMVSVHLCVLTLHTNLTDGRPDTKKSNLLGS